MSLDITAPHSSETRTDTSPLPTVHHPGARWTHGTSMARLAQKSQVTELWVPLPLGSGAELLTLSPLGSLVSVQRATITKHRASFLAAREKKVQLLQFHLGGMVLRFPDKQILRGLWGKQASGLAYRRPHKASGTGPLTVAIHIQRNRMFRAPWMDR